ncbi:MAG: hypothetical protein WCJ19_00730 [bacterium]
MSDNVEKVVSDENIIVNDVNDIEKENISNPPSENIIPQFSPDVLPSNKAPLTPHKKNILTLSIIGGTLVVLASVAVILAILMTNKTVKKEDVIISPTTSVYSPYTEVVFPTDIKVTETITPSNTPIPESLNLGSVPVKLLDKPIRLYNINAFKYVSSNDYQGPGMGYPPANVDIDSINEYYKIGTITDGGYKDYNLIYTFSNGSFGTSSFPTLEFVMLSKDNKFIVANYMNYSYTDSDGKTISNDYQILAPNNFGDSTSEIKDTEIYKTLNKSNISVKKINFTNATITSISDPSYFKESMKSDNGVQIYVSSSDIKSPIYTKTKEGFFMINGFAPNFYSSSEPPNISWTLGNTGKNKYQYDYISIGSCGMGSNGMGSYGVEITDLSMDLLKQTGTTSDNDPVYEFKDPNADTYTKKIYVEDYPNINKYNTITEDDASLLPYNDFVKYHPVFYWKDPFGRLIKFASREFIMTGGCAKPAVYLYPTKDTKVNVKLSIDGALTYSEPRYDQGWNVLAKPNGDLVINDKTFDYLFWEGKFNTNFENLNNGWVILKSDVKIFLAQKLDELGFNEKEKAQFLEYWIPRLDKENNKYIYINFVDEKFLDRYAPLTITPKPENYKRYFMLYRGEDSERKTTEPVLSKVNRSGFFMFEWGGARIN